MHISTLFFLYIFLKVVAAVSFIIAGSICLNTTCAIDEDLSASFIGFGLSIIFSACLSYILYSIATKNKYNVRSRNILFVFSIKIAVAIILLIIGMSILKANHLIAAGFIGAGGGTMLFTLVSITLMALYLSHPKN